MTNPFSPLAPIALFVYNRPKHTLQTVEALQQNQLALESDLIVFSDAPKESGATTAVHEVRDYIRGIAGFKSVTIVERNSNFGLAVSIIDGVTRLCDEYGRVIVLEDDLVVSPYFLEYMNTAIERYRNDERVMQISGHMFPVDIAAETDAVFLPMTTSWGWATWQRAWRHFDPLASGYDKLKRDAKLRRAFNLDGAYDYFCMMEQQLRGKIDSWAIRWYLSVFLRGGFVLFPVKSLVENTGFDGSGIHCGVGCQCDPIPDCFKVNHFPAVAINEEARQTIYNYLKKQYGRINRFRRMNSKEFIFKLIRYALRIPLRVYWLAEGYFKELNCILARGSKLFPSSIIDNLRGEKKAIKIDSHTFVLGQLLVFKHGGHISIGQHCYIGENARIWSAGHIIIGNRVLISHGVNIHDNDAHSMSAKNRHNQIVELFSTGHPDVLEDVPARPIVIEDDVWIGFNATILKGVNIGKGAVIGAGSVVTKNVLPYNVVVGNPAIVVGSSKE